MFAVLYKGTTYIDHNNNGYERCYILVFILMAYMGIKKKGKQKCDFTILLAK